MSGRIRHGGGPRAALEPAHGRVKRNTQPVPADPIRPCYDALGVEGYYQAHAQSYRNPHESQIRHLLRWWVEGFDIPAEASVLDLACGSGEVTLGLRSLGRARCEGMDPFTFTAYTARTGLPCRVCSFEQLVQESVDGEATLFEARAVPRYDAVVCSFALHLLEASRLPGLCQALARLAPMLLVLTPHKRPELREAWGAVQLAECLHERVRARVYRLTTLG